MTGDSRGPRLRTRRLHTGPHHDVLSCKDDSSSDGGSYGRNVPKISVSGMYFLGMQDHLYILTNYDLMGYELYL